MPLITIIIVLALIGGALYFINYKCPKIDGRVKTIINWVVFVAIALWLLRVFHVWHYLEEIRV
jgi:hypothetical protein